MAARPIQAWPRRSLGKPARTGLAFARSLAVLAEPDFEEHEAGREHEAEPDQDQRRDRADIAADHQGAHDAGDHQRAGRAEGRYPRALGHRIALSDGGYDAATTATTRGADALPELAGRRMMADIDGDFLVFLIGARFNSKLRMREVSRTWAVDAE